MARTLDEKDLVLLKKLAPELGEIICEYSQVPFRSILPPLSNHISTDAKDFERRLRTLTDGELKYLVDMILKGRESLPCMSPEYAEAFISLVAERISQETAEGVLNAYLELVCF
jgi:hypothetical protein